MAKNKILIVDDEIINIHLLANFLSPQHDTISSTNGMDALDKAYAQEPELILLDIMMPGLDGYKVCERLKSNPQTAHIPVIFVSALGTKKDIEKGLKWTLSSRQLFQILRYNPFVYF